jgi:hypothetical protein
MLPSEVGSGVTGLLVFRNAGGLGGFRIDATETGYMKGPKPWNFMYRGSATK